MPLLPALPEVAPAALYLPELHLRGVHLMDWTGDNPYFLVIHPTDGEPTGIDLDFPGWTTKNSELLRRPGSWYLFRKADAFQALRIHVRDGDQPYYTARHVGRLGSGGSNEIIAYGIGKKQIDGSMVRLWVLPNGAVCGGDDVDDIGVALVNQLGPR